MAHTLFDISFTQKNKQEVISWIEERIKNSETTVIVTPNPEMIMEIQKNKDFKETLQKADLRIADGIGILWASKYITLPNRFKGKKRKLWALWQVFYSLLSIIFYPPYLQKFIPERISGSDLLWDIIKICEREHKRPFFLGAAPGVAEKVREKVIAAYPHIQVAGVYAGVPDAEYDGDIRHVIESSDADIVFVAYGAPKQEFWMERSRDKFKTSKLLIGVGGSFDFISGNKKRAPFFLRKIGLEWLFRLLIEPWRYMRIYTATIRFISFVVKQKLYKN